MKKILAMLLAAAMLFAFAGCGEKKSDIEKLEEDLDKITSELEEELDNAGGLIGDDDDYNEGYSGELIAGDDDDETVGSVQEYVDMMLDSTEFEQLISAAEAQGADFELKADGNDLVYIYKYTVAVPDNTGELLEEQMTGEAAELMEQSADLLRVIINGMDKMVIEYYAQDGTLIADFEF